MSNFVKRHGVSWSVTTDNMPLGSGTKQKEAKASKKNAKSDSQSNEAAEILKKMEAKKDSGECAFC